MTDEVGRILVVEDDARLRALIDTALTRAGWQVCPVPDAEAAVVALEEFRPEVAVLDIHLGEGPDGLALARRIRDGGNLPFLFLTDRTAVEDRLAGFESGADDFLGKPFVVAELLARLRVLLRRSTPRPPAAPPVVEIGPLVLDAKGRQASLDGAPVDLTRIEFELLTTLAAQVGTVASKAELLARVWGFDGYDQNLVEVHVSSLRRKLGPHATLVQTVRGVGYVLRPPREPAG